MKTLLKKRKKQVYAKKLVNPFNIKPNSIFAYFILSQLLFLLGYFYETDLILNIKCTNAFVLQLIGILFFILGGFSYSTFPRIITSTQTKSKFFLSDKFFIFSYLLILIGVIESAAQVFIFVSPFEYFSSLFANTYVPGLRDVFLTSSGDGGLPGYIKIFSYAPLSIYLMALGLLTFSDCEQRFSLQKLSIYALVGTLIKVLFSIDRLSIMAILLANIFIAIKNRSLIKMKYFLSIIFVLLLANYLSLKRLEGYGIFDFILLYFKLGLTNFQLMINTVTSHTYGFATFLSPLSFIGRVFGINIHLDSIYSQFSLKPQDSFREYGMNISGSYDAKTSRMRSVNGTINFRLAPKAHIDINSRYDYSTNEFTSMKYKLDYDMHSFMSKLTYDSKSRDMWLEIYLKGAREKATKFYYDAQKKRLKPVMRHFDI
jgi:hypothetical protein